MRKIGYARTSKTNQNLSLDDQIEKLQNAGCEKRDIFSEHVSGRKVKRVEFNRMLESLESGDMLVVCKLDRLGRTTKQLIELVEWMNENDISLKILDMDIDTSTPSGKMFFTIFAGFAQMEAELISERTKSALDYARKQGRKGGRKKTISDDQIEYAKHLMETREDLTGQQIAEKVGVSRASLYRVLKEAKLN